MRAKEINSIIDKFSRQIIVFGVKKQLKLYNSRVAIIGCGATGSSIAEALVRVGVGFIRVIDRDFVEISNLHRVHLYTEDDAIRRMPKAIACKNRLKEIDSGVEVEAIVDDVDADNIEDFIKDVDLVIDGTDNIDTRYLINEACIKLRKPWVMIGVERWHGNAKLIVPGKTACLKCFIPVYRTRRENVCEFLGVTTSAVELATAIAISIALKYLLDDTIDDNLYVIDSYTPSVDKIHINKNPSCPLCSGKQFEYLGKKIEKTKIMCGIKAIKILPENRIEIDFKTLLNSGIFKNLKIYDNVIAYGEINDIEIAILHNGKMFIKGTTDIQYALKLYENIMKTVDKNI